MGFKHFSVASLAAILFCAITPLPAQADLLGITYAEGRLWDINPTTGAGSNPRESGVNDFIGIALSPRGILFGVTNAGSTTGVPNSLYRIDRATGAATLVGPLGLPYIAEGDVAFDPTTGVMYCAGAGPTFTQVLLFTVNTDTAAATVIGSLGANRDYAQGLAFDSNGQLFALNATDKQLNRIDKTTADLQGSVNLNVATMGNVGALAIDRDAGRYYVADSGAGGTNLLYLLNPQNGSMTTLGPLPSTALSGLAVVPPVPEPASFTLLMIGLGTCSGLRCRQKTD